MTTLLAVLAHPDDESMGTGGLIIRHTRNDVAVHLVCATHGEQGWGGKPPGARREDLADIRAAEMEEAASALALTGVELWDYPDGGLDKSDHAEITRRIAEEITRVRPSAIVTWGPDGGYGHPDHIAIGACTDAAVTAMPEGERPALYHIAVDQQLADFYLKAPRLSSSGSDSPKGVVTDPVDLVLELSSDEVLMKLRAVYCHVSQLADWMVELRDHPDVLAGWGHEPYMVVPSRPVTLAGTGLLAEFA
jgi:LmbE family N-acetylglucosaminyl deacetylase